MSQYEFDIILQKYLAGNYTPEEEKIVLEWHKTFLQDSKVQLSGEEKALLERKLWAGIEKQIIPGSDTKKITRPYWINRYLKYAAACLLVLLIPLAYLFLRHKNNTEQQPPYVSGIQVPGDYSETVNNNNTPQKIILSDGSVVELQTGSHLFFPSKFSGADRNVYLTGNAFFTVAQDSIHHFKVHTSEGLVAEVLGTSFYILHHKHAKEVEVSVVTGKVSVFETSAGNTARHPIILTPNQKVSFETEASKFTTSLVADPNPVSGKVAQASFIYEETPIANILRQLQDTYNIPIQTDNESLHNCHFTGDISAMTLYDKIDVVCKSVQASYEVKGTVIYIKGGNCNSK